MRFAGIFALGAAQGALGWYMVRSGLVDDPRVSQFRLTAHLGLAFLIFAAMLWCALSLLSRPSANSAAANSDFSAVGRWAAAVACLVFLQVLAGGMVAGIRAGYAYNTFPSMNGEVVPAEIMMLAPWWKNFFYNMATVQFDHRLLAWILAVVIPSCGGRWYATRMLRGACGSVRTCCSRCLPCRRRWASSRSSTSSRCRSPRCIRRAPCFCSHWLSISPMHCADDRAGCHGLPGFSPDRTGLLQRAIPAIICGSELPFLPAVT